MTKADFEAMRDNIAEIKTILIRREECAKKCEQVHKWAFGNGVRGADEVLAKLERAAEDMRRWRWRLLGMVPSVVTGVVVGVVVLIAGKYL
jgi:hypothetical protein